MDFCFDSFGQCEETLAVSDFLPNDASISLKGQLLLADPSLRDGIFHHSVIYLSEHDEENGAYGIVLNKPSEHLVGDLLKEEEFRALNKLRVYIGGPVSQEHLTFAAIWWSEKKGRLRCNPRISAEDAVKRVNQPGTLVRAFIGYSGWEAGQLENELRNQSWFTERPNRTLLQREHSESLWGETLCDISPFHRLIAEAPENPFLN